MAVKKTWQKQLAEGVADLATLLKLLAIDAKYLATVAHHPFKLRVPLNFVAKMKKGDINDPLLRQVLPIKEESAVIPGFSQDPLQEKKYNPLPGVIHKYRSRILLTLTGACAVHCRYCFRRHFPYEENRLIFTEQEKIFNYIKQQPQVDEIILSGGDPLVVSDKLLQNWLEQFALLAQLKYLRIHTRLPIVLPDRITDELIDLLTTTRLQVIVVVHSNHPQEIDTQVQQALLKLTQKNITVLNQSVLLKDVNDNAIVLAELSQQLFKARVLPYYLHLLDKVSGVHHFAVDEVTVRQLWQELSHILPGYLLPRLVREESGAGSKTWLV